MILLSDAVIFLGSKINKKSNLFQGFKHHNKTVYIKEVHNAMVQVANEVGWDQLPTPPLVVPQTHGDAVCTSNPLNLSSYELRTIDSSPIYVKRNNNNCSQ